MAIEKELKLALGDANVNEAIDFLSADSGTNGQTFTLGNIYFDTPSGALASARVALRLRRTASGWLQTLKTAGKATNGLHARGEWELPVAGDALELPALLAQCDDPDAAASLRALAPDVAPVFRTDFERTTWLVTVDGAEIEAALDLGFVHLGTSERLASTASAPSDVLSEIPIREIELELKSGDEAALMAFSARLRAAVPGLSPDNVSKAARGYRLLKAHSTQNDTAGGNH
jgi:inorganic triphosphatase YgiF